MPLHSLNDYLPTIDLYLAHWAEANAAKPAPLVLEGGETRADLQTVRAEFAQASATVLKAENDAQAGAAKRDLARKDALSVGRAARNAILGLIPSSPEAKSLPTIPGDGADPEKQLTALRDVEAIWQSLGELPKGQYPSLPRPLTVEVEDAPGKVRHVGLGAYSVSVAALDSELQALRVASQERTRAQKDRQKAAEHGKALLTRYAETIRRVFPRTSAVYRSLPKLSG